MAKREVLRQYFGHTSFRPGQEALIDGILAGRDALGIMPTGGGQVPVLSGPGTAAAGADPGGVPADLPDEGSGGGPRTAWGFPRLILNSALDAQAVSQAVCRADSAGDAQTDLRRPGAAADQEGFLALVQEPKICPGGGGRGPLHLPVGPGLPAQLSEDRGVCGPLCPGGRCWRPSPPPPRAEVREDILPPAGAAGPGEWWSRASTGRTSIFEVQQPSGQAAGASTALVRASAGTRAALSTAPPGRRWRRSAQLLCGAGHLRHPLPRGAVRGGAPAESGRTFSSTGKAGDGGHQRLWHGHRQVQCALCHPLQHAQEFGGLLSGGRPGGPGRGGGGVHPPLRAGGCGHCPVSSCSRRERTRTSPQRNGRRFRRGTPGAWRPW